MTPPPNGRHDPRRRDAQPAETVNPGRGTIAAPPAATPKGDLDMRRTWWIIPVLLLATVSLSMLAGDTSKCSAGTDECLKKMVQKYQQAGWLGIEKEKGPDGPVVAAVVPGSPAEAAGFLKGDILVALDGVRFTAENEAKLKEIRKDFVPGRRVDYTVRRVGKEIELTVTLAALPPDVMAQMIGMHMIEHAQPAPAEK